ncbi:MAG: ATP-dependent zinc protease [Magnetococcales bacterium]|nr:ATP-dependent zinc protease [Magnetococcales bacterium]
MRGGSACEGESLVAGWREWVALPDLGVARIKAKLDTGARTSALHALEPKVFVRGGVRRVRFRLHPEQRHGHPEILCEAPLVDRRLVVNSGGKPERRLVILTRLVLAGCVFPVEITLTNRAPMGFRMLMGRTAIRKWGLVDPGRSFLLSAGIAELP